MIPIEELKHSSFIDIKIVATLLMIPIEELKLLKHLQIATISFNF